MKMPRFIRLQQEKDGYWETIETFEVIPKLAQGPQAKRFFITERQLRELKTILEHYEDAPQEINETHKDPIQEERAAVNRELRFLIEDIEAQEARK